MKTPDTEPPFDLLIVGGGMVGAALAAACSGQGLRIAVTETGSPRVTGRRVRSTCASPPSAEPASGCWIASARGGGPASGSA